MTRLDFCCQFRGPNFAHIIYQNMSIHWQIVDELVEHMHTKLLAVAEKPPLGEVSFKTKNSMRKCVRDSASSLNNFSKHSYHENIVLFTFFLFLPETSMFENRKHSLFRKNFFICVIDC